MLSVIEGKPLRNASQDGTARSAALTITSLSYLRRLKMREDRHHAPLGSPLPISQYACDRRQIVHDDRPRGNRSRHQAPSDLRQECSEQHMLKPSRPKTPCRLQAGRSDEARAPRLPRAPKAIGTSRVDGRSLNPSGRFSRSGDIGQRLPIGIPDDDLGDEERDFKTMMTPDHAVEAGHNLTITFAPQSATLPDGQDVMAAGCPDHHGLLGRYTKDRKR